MKISLTHSILIVFFLLIVRQGYSQLKYPVDHDFGDGIVKINLFSFPPGMIVPGIATPISEDHAWRNFVFIIKGQKILHDIDYFSDADKAMKRDSTLDKPAGAPVVEMARFKYLIDWKTQLSYTFFGSAQSDTVRETPLSKLDYDLFYKAAAINKNKIEVKSLTLDSMVTIAGHKCFKGIAISSSAEPITFYYTREKIKVSSPLNNMFSTNETIQILAMYALSNYTLPDGQVTKAPLLLKVDFINENSISHSIFSLPKNAIILKNVPVSKLFKF